MIDHPLQNYSINLHQAFMLICMQKINFINYFFLKILQRNSKLVVLGNFGMSCHTLKMVVSVWRNRWCLSAIKKSSSFFTFLEILQRYCKFVVIGTLGIPGFTHPKWYYHLVENCLSPGKKSTSFPCLSGDIAKICRLEYFGHASIFNCIPKINLIINYFLKILQFKESHNLIDWQYFAHNSRTRSLPDRGLVVKYQYYFSFYVISKKN